MSTVVIAPDSFKGSASNSDVAKWIGEGWKSVRPHDKLVLIPMADGGEGSLSTITGVRDDVDVFTLSVIGADGGSNRAQWLLLDDGTAIVELASACGITSMNALDPLNAHTYGLGQVLNDVRQNPEVERIAIALGGSGSTDGGTGALRALGFGFYDGYGDEIPLGGDGLNELVEIETTNFVKPPRGGVACWIDVSNPLLGEQGAAAVFGPQKGANEDEVVILEEGLKNFMKVCKVPDAAGSGAAGGAAYGLRAGWGATYVAGSAAIASIVGLPEAIAAADYVITGEGRLDHQSFGGKVVGYVRQVSAALGKPVGYCVGSTLMEFPGDGIGGRSLVELSGSVEAAMNDPRTWIIEAARELAQSVSAIGE